MSKRGPSDELLTGNPQITYFKNVYRRHTFFMKHIIEKVIPPSVLKDSSIEPIDEPLLSGSMDLISDIYIKNQIKYLTKDSKIFANVGNNLIDTIKININGKSIYEIDGLAMEMVAELENPYIHSMKTNHVCPPYLEMNPDATLPRQLSVYNGNNYNMMCFAGGVSGVNCSGIPALHVAESTCDTSVFFTRPDFDFCKTYDKSFPICALNNTGVMVHAIYRESAEIGTFTNKETLCRTLVIENIILSSEEKRRIIQNTDIYNFVNITHQQTPGPISHSNKPIRMIYMAGTKDQNPSEIYSKSTPTLIPTCIINVLIGGKNMIEGRVDTGSGDNNNVQSYTRENVYRYYRNSGFGGRNLNITGTANTGQYDSVGIYTQSLDNNNGINGFITSVSNIRVLVVPSTINISIYTELISYYKIRGGQIMIY